MTIAQDFMAAIERKHSLDKEEAVLTELVERYSDQLSHSAPELLEQFQKVIQLRRGGV
jgi:hypothetical protein